MILAVAGDASAAKTAVLNARQTGLELLTEWQLSGDTGIHIVETNFVVTVHSVHSNVAKIHSRLPAAMEFWLVCRDFGIFMPKHLAGQWCVNSNLCFLIHTAGTEKILDFF